MKYINHNYRSSRSLTLVGLAVLIVSACYDEFDPASYQPVFTVSGYAATDEIQPGSLVAYWPFDGGLTEMLSGIEATNHEATLVNGFKGQGISFNANSPSWLVSETPETVASLQSFTISFWVNPTFVDSDGNNLNDGILGLVTISNPTRFWGNVEWFVENNSNPDSADIKVIVTHNATDATQTDILVNNYKGLFDSWTNHTLTYDAGTSTLSYYINGSRLASKVTPWTGPIALVGSGPMVFGTAQFQTSPSMTTHGPEGWASHLTGSIDEVRIYNSALSETDINALVVLQGKGK